MMMYVLTISRITYLNQLGTSVEENWGISPLKYLRIIMVNLIINKNNGVTGVLLNAPSGAPSLTGRPRSSSSEC